MKTKAILLFLFTSISLFAQTEKFIFTENGVTKELIVSTAGNSQDQLYKKTLQWINRAYKNPKDVIVANEENTFVKIDAFAPALFDLGKGIFCDGKYTLGIFFKDGKYKIQIFDIEQEISGYGWIKFIGFTDGSFYLKNGKRNPKTDALIESVLSFFNSLNSSLQEFILHPETDKSKDW